MKTTELQELERLLEAAIGDETVAGRIVIGAKRAGTDLVRALDAVRDELADRIFHGVA